MPYVEASPQLCVQGKKDLAVNTFLPLLNQLISPRGGCQEGVRLGGLWEVGAADLGVVMPKPEIQGLASLPERKTDTPPSLVKIKPYTMTNTCKPSQPNACFLRRLLHSTLVSPQSFKNNSLHQEALWTFKCFLNIQVIRFCKAQHRGFSTVQTHAKATDILKCLQVSTCSSIQRDHPLCLPKCT